MPPEALRQLADLASQFCRRDDLELPPSAVAIVLRLGLWTGQQALAHTRRTRGDWPAATIAAIAPYLDAPEIERLLIDKHVYPLFPWISLRIGVERLLVRLAQLAGNARALAAYKQFPASLRALLAPTARALIEASVDDHAHQLAELVADTARHCHLIDRVYEQADVVFEVLPAVTDTATQQQLIARTIERVYDEDFPLSPEVWRKLAAVDEPRVRAEALRTQSDYPRAWKLAAVSFHQGKDLRNATLDAWLAACERLVAKGFALRGNLIPYPLPPRLLRATQTFLHTTSPADRAYVLIQLSKGHPELVSTAVDNLQTLPNVAQALAWVTFASGLSPDHQLTRQAVTTFRQRLGTSLFNEQRAWIGWWGETESTPQWCARAIAMLPTPEQPPALAGLLRQLLERHKPTQ